MRPGQHGSATELLAVICPNRLGQPSRLGQLIEHSGELHAANRAFRNNCDRLVRSVIYNGQAFDDATFRRPVKYEIH